ncbi:cupin domain-containing protein [Paraburkholderia sp. CNPSo 3274]|uniref:cupin domain-containing protein n=1 Tax=Paraburkholderia sp. CNPSo 3274 TaxID=2940932 RepID=UPI0020B79DEA|nr:cupin domain-containing protein [Paraburkholderia sp. CNPSo 3274]MCP3710924.1 cupin domain-containing protein [Paraburkholderia sp. CNPSo 3274]
MSPDAFPYLTRLDVLYAFGEIIDVPALVAANRHPWYNQTLCEVNQSVVRLGVVQGEYHWHKHDAEDEFFYVVSGHFLIDLEDRVIDLSPGQAFVVRTARLTNLQYRKLRAATGHIPETQVHHLDKSD